MGGFTGRSTPHLYNAGFGFRNESGAGIAVVTIIAGATLGLSTLFAALIPALRASLILPLDALRTD